MEADAIAADFESAGVPVVARLDAPATADGGDTIWLDEQTLLVGRGYRTSDDGIHALRAALPEVSVLGFDLPHLHGSDVVLHLLSLLSPLDEDLVVAYLPLTAGAPGATPDRARDPDRRDSGRRVRDDGRERARAPPRVALALEGNDETRRRLERAGVDVAVYSGDEISRKGDGGPTCLTRPLLRA